MTYTTSPQSHASLTVADGVVRVTITRPDKRNAISPEVTDLLWTAARRLRDDDAARVMVIAAEGKYFTAGIDLATGGPGAYATTLPQQRREYREHHLLYDELEAIEKPVVMAIQGPCLGAGVEMSVSCDFRLAARSATFGLPEIQLGVIPGSGGVSRLTRLVGPHWAKWLAMADMRIDAERALAIGLVHDVHDDEDFAGAVDRFVERLVSLPPEALGVAKLTIDMVAEVDRRTARDVERIANSPLVLGGEFRRRLEAFQTRSASRGGGRS
ncbi:enoyl-CoA hydratase/isomerase family protein [Dactylosporangium sp. AC04546]|uniref:enoyl-CoA hydratase/isomerase family protein n=1 Tax=Dactylosporangium sp. AC04546 TaxID=2862460 RepID=UPI001EDF171F|nr:enoyl-CoA hydratase/isomerase family protein [Dactylosporangium sp. AC04546]WVK86835.1 enoyl-CoA hydratase/isomerase family protein [Dactylosporangium sp. AC04546]